ncbi:MFS transporter [Primorskyibacter sp. 2E107]|uniref:MFS transporter n=1 Tax=Primorskyibacter sp. 2E107 TaxID=3403458 RepID=UPI003AF6633A
MTGVADRLYDTVAETDGETPPGEARNALRHIGSLSTTKIADGLIDPKLVLSWLGQALGAPAAITGLFVPIREAGALLPQILLAGWVQKMTHRKWAWVLGSAGQGIGAALIVLSALTLEGMAAGLAICAALALLALSRAACSVSFKDILGKTIAKHRRGTVTGVAGSAASLAVVIFALLLMSGLLREQAPVIAAIGLAAGLWLAAAALFSTLEEDPSDTGEAQSLDFTPLREDGNFRRFIAVRGLLTVTALAPPYFVLLGGGQGALKGLGALLLASALASFVSSYVWGRLADHSARLVLALSGLCGAGFALLAVAAETFGWSGSGYVIPAILFGFMLAYQGVRRGRSVYLVDISPEESRARYAALANTVIGGLLLAVGGLGGALAVGGPLVALAGFAVLSLIGGLLAFRLRDEKA